MFPSLLAVLSALFGKYLLDILSGAWIVQNPYQIVIGIAAGMLLLAICSAAAQKAGLYAQSMHEEIMSKVLTLQMMERASDADMEYFDNPEYYDKLTACMRDISAIQYLLWNVLSAVSAGISFGAIFVILSFENVAYSLIILAAAIPASIASAKYIKLICGTNISGYGRDCLLRAERSTAPERY